MSEMHVLTRDGKLVSVELPGCPFVEPKTDVQGDVIMRELSELLGRKLGCVKLGGYWLIGDTTNVWRPIFGHLPGQQTRKFSNALGAALNCAIVTRVPVK